MNERVNGLNADATRLRRASHEDVCFQNRLRSANSTKKNNNKLGLGLGGLASIIYFFCWARLQLSSSSNIDSDCDNSSSSRAGLSYIMGQLLQQQQQLTTLCRIFWDRRCRRRRSALCSLTDDATSPLSSCSSGNKGRAQQRTRTKFS